MKIILDPQVFNMQTYGGISRYYAEVFSRLNKRKELSITLPIYSSNNVYVADTGLIMKEKKLINSLVKTLNFIGISTRSLSRKISEKQVKEPFKDSNFDLFVPTYYNPYFLEFIGDKPFVLTVYDMIHEIMPQYFVGDPWNVTINKKILIEKATKIIAVSNNTKKDILKVYPQIDESKIEVIHHGSSIKINDNLVVDLPDNYILFVGSRDNYKNFRFLVEAIKELLVNDSTLKLICAGGGKFKEDELVFIKQLGLQNKVEQRYFEEEELGLFYKKARCFVFPSMYEGFGIPVLESMACGCPIVLSNCSSFPEVAGEAGIFFDVSSKKDLKEKIALVLSDEKFRNEHILKGIERIKQFSWETAASRCFDLYKRAIN
ncbi:glycosyltransferase family 1 protein [Flavobacterium sp. NG2]|uniref:glycosyltransferase family 4 protein n=1 Tax=Flavobacterium sp. NG2 TaxID=3097547 RepID=UPI002A7FD8EC|nr:glycosyltransferase family 1 protein [Flavobacterium sp. NG2]WPR72899.1 glycosyltransferase family 1 protein [Flavobacterium sp. NG2]